MKNKEKKKFGINLVAFLLLLVSLLSANMAFALPPVWKDLGCHGGDHVYIYSGVGGSGWIIFHNAPECS